MRDMGAEGRERGCGRFEGGMASGGEVVGWDTGVGGGGGGAVVGGADVEED